MVEESAVLGHGVPPMGHEASATRGHPIEIGFVHKAIADVIVGGHIEFFFGETAHRIEHETGLESRREIWVAEVHVPFGDEEFCFAELRKASEAGALFGDV